jgi:multidrug resistance efflux pump
LPARYREPVILCYLEGRTHAEAARELGCPKGTVAIRLLRARKLLKKRLTRRGITLAGGIIALAATPPASAALVARTLRTAFGGAVPVRVTSLSEGVIRAMSLTRLKVSIAAVVLVAGLLAASSMIVARQEPPAEKPAADPGRPGVPAAPSPPKAELVSRVPALCDGVLQLVGAEIPPGENVPPGRRVVVETGFLLVPVKSGETVKPEHLFGDAETGQWRRWREDDPLEPERIQLKRVKKEFRPLEIGDEVKSGQLVAQVDAALALSDLAYKIAALNASESERRASARTKEEAERRVAAMETSIRNVPGSVSKDDYEGAKLTAARYREEEVAKKAAVLKAEQELAQAHTILSMCDIRTPASGVIRSIERETGDPVKALETVLTVGPANVGRAAKANAARERLVRAPRDGVLVALGTPAKDGETVTPDDLLHVGSGTSVRRYRRVKLGDTVEAGQIYGQLDDRLARSDVLLKQAKLAGAEAEARAAVKTREEAERRVKAMERSMGTVPGSVSKDDYEGAKLTCKRYLEEEIGRKAAVNVCQAELERSKTLLKSYELHSPARGVVRELPKSNGEAVHAGDPVLRISVSQ